MDLKLKRCVNSSTGQPVRWDYEAILANARTLQFLGDTAGSRRLLGGRHVAMLSETEQSGDADLFSSAARGLGAQVAEIRTELWPMFPREEIQRMAVLLDRLYVAVECQGLFRPLVQIIGAATRIPVYDHIASPDHPTAQVVELLGGNATRDEKRKLVLQAVLLGTIA